MINELKHNEVFVFGSNIEGHHMGGAARQAYDQFGAEWGIGVGLTGRSYAIPTMGGFEQIKQYSEQFIHFAELTPQFTYLLTKIGCGIAGYTEEEIKPLFEVVPSNIIKPEGW